MVFRPGGLTRRVAALAVACLAGPIAATLTPVAAHAGATVAVVSSSQWGPDPSQPNLYHWVGEVRNNGDTSSKPYNASVIRVAALDVGGHIVGTAADAEAVILGPTQSSPFDIQLAGTCGGCTLQVTFAPTADPPNQRFMIAPLPPTVTTDPDGIQHITGTVTNNNTTPADLVKVIATFYSGLNGTGSVVDEAFFYIISNSTSSLNAGEGAPFEIVRTNKSPSLSMAVIADSPTAPSLPIVTPSSSPFDVGGVHVGSSGTKAMTITNSGNDDLHITSLSLGGANVGEFGLVCGSQDTCTGYTVTPSSTCSIGVTFTPTAIGVRTAVVNIVDDTANNPDAVPFAG